MSKTLGGTGDSVGRGYLRRGTRIRGEKFKSVRGDSVLWNL